MNAKQIVQKYLDIFFGERFNPEILKPLLTDNFCFRGTLMEASNSQEFILKLKSFGEEIDMNAKIHKLVCEGNSVVAQYDFISPNGSRVPASEWYDVGGEKIAEMFLFCDSKLFFEK